MSDAKRVQPKRRTIQVGSETSSSGAECGQGAGSAGAEALSTKVEWDESGDFLWLKFDCLPMTMTVGRNSALKLAQSILELDPRAKAQKLVKEEWVPTHLAVNEEVAVKIVRPTQFLAGWILVKAADGREWFCEKIQPLL